MVEGGRRNTKGDGRWSEVVDMGRMEGNTWCREAGAVFPTGVLDETALHVPSTPSCTVLAQDTVVVPK